MTSESSHNMPSKAVGHAGQIPDMSQLSQRKGQRVAGTKGNTPFRGFPLSRTAMTDFQSQTAFTIAMKTGHHVGSSPVDSTAGDIEPRHIDISKIFEIRILENGL